MEYEFCISFDGTDYDYDEKFSDYADMIYNGVGDDVFVYMSNLKFSVDFTREAFSLAEAIRLAVIQIRNSIPNCPQLQVSLTCDVEVFTED